MKNRRASEPCSNAIMATDSSSSKDELERLRHLKAVKLEEEQRESYRIRPRKRFV